MWNCPECGCMNILGLTMCPQCHVARPEGVSATSVSDESVLGTSVAVETKSQTLEQEEGIMPRITVDGPSNADLVREPDLVGVEEGVSSSAGMSSLTSESRQDKSGTSTTTDLSSPARETESLSGRDQAKSQESFSASSAGTSGHATTSARRSQPDSSEDSPVEEKATLVRPSSSRTRRN